MSRDSGSTRGVARTAPMFAALGDETRRPTAVAVRVLLGLAVAPGLVVVRRMGGLGLGVEPRRGPRRFFVALCVWQRVALMLPGAAPAVVSRVPAGGVRAVPVFIGWCL